MIFLYRWLELLSELLFANSVTKCRANPKSNHFKLWHPRQRVTPFARFTSSVRPAPIRSKAHSISAATWVEGSKRTSAPVNKRNSLWRFLDRYSHKLDPHALATKALTGGIMAGMGDGLCQEFIRNDKPYDVVRTARFGLVGAAFISPGIHALYNILATEEVRTWLLSNDQFLFAQPFIAGLLSSQSHPAVKCTK